MNPQEQSVLPPELSQPDALLQHTLVVAPREENIPPEEPVRIEEAPVKKNAGRPKDTAFAVLASLLVTGAVAGGAFMHGVYTRPSAEVSVASVVAVAPSVPVPEVGFLYGEG
jgi:hypothetical protein